MIQKIKKFFKDEEGATAVEYGLMVALIAAVVITGATMLGESTDTVFQAVAGEIDDVAPVATPQKVKEVSPKNGKNTTTICSR